MTEFNSYMYLGAASITRSQIGASTSLGDGEEGCVVEAWPKAEDGYDRAIYSDTRIDGC